MDIDQGARGPFEVHVGFPAGQDRLFRRLLGGAARWKPTQFDSVWRNLGVTRYEAHDVPGGIRHLATSLSSTYEDAMSTLRSAREVIGNESGIRAEIEKVMKSPADVHRREGQTASEAPAPGLIFVNDLPAWESHISFRFVDEEAFSPSLAMDMANSVGKEFNEIAYSNQGRKLILTTFWHSPDLMFDNAPRLAKNIKQTFPLKSVIKLSMEQILICAKFN